MDVTDSTLFDDGSVCCGSGGSESGEEGDELELHGCEDVMRN